MNSNHKRKSIQIFTTTWTAAPQLSGPHSLRRRHDVPAAAFVHRHPFLWLLAEIHCLLAATATAAAFDQRAEKVRCTRPVAVGVASVAVGVGVASVAVVTAVVALRMEMQMFSFYFF